MCIRDRDIYQYLPWDHRGWHAGGKANDTHIGFEICEPAGHTYRGPEMIGYDAAMREDYFRKVFRRAAELCAYLCRLYGLSERDIITHCEGLSLIHIFSVLEELIEGINLHSVEWRLARVLLSRADKNNVVVLNTTKGNFASQIGMSRETLSRKFALFREKRWIKFITPRKILITDRKALEEIL